MARLSEAEMEQAVADAMASSGGRATHAELFASLDEQGKGRAILRMPYYVQQGHYKAELPFNGTDKPVLTYVTQGV